MKKLLIFTNILTLHAFFGIAQDYHMKIHTSTPRLILGIPIQLQVQIEGPKPLRLPYVPAMCDPGFLKLKVINELGEEVPYRYPFNCPSIEHPPIEYYQGKVLIPPVEFPIRLLLKAGKYRIQVYYKVESKDWPMNMQIRDKPEILPWHGELYAPEVFVEVLPPEGEDREIWNMSKLNINSLKDIQNFWVYLEDHQEIILDRYPTSTYAPWVLLRKLYGPDPYNMKRWVNPLHPETTPSWAPQFKDDEAHHFLFIIRNVLQNHPEFPFLNHMKYAEIGMLNQLNRRKELIKRLEVYRHDPDPITAQWAQFYYDVFTKGKGK